MEWVFNQLALGTPEQRLLALAGLVFMAGIGFFPAPLDMLLAATGVMVAKNVIPYFGSIFVSIVVILFCEFIAFELGKVFGDKVLSKPGVRRKLGEKRLQNIYDRLQRSEYKIARTLRFNILLKSYFVFVASALGLSRKTFYKVHVTVTLIYVPLLIGVLALISKLIPLQDWQIVAGVWALWILSVIIPGRKKTETA